MGIARASSNLVRVDFLEIICLTRQVFTFCIF